MTTLQIELNEDTQASRRIPVYLVDITDGFTPETGLAGSAVVTVSKNGAALGASGGTFAEVSAGWYYYEATAGEVDTLGFLAINVADAAARVFPGLVQIIPADQTALLAQHTETQSRLPATLVGGRMDSDVGNMQVGVVDGIVDAGAEEAVADHVALGTMGRAALLDLYRDGDGKGIAIFYDVDASNINTVLGEDGTQDNPVSSAAAVMSLGTALGIKRAVLDVGLLTLDQDFEFWRFEGDWERGSQMDTAGFSVLGALFRGLNVVTAAQNGFAAFQQCFLYGNMTGLGGAYTNCIMKGGGTGSFTVSTGGFAVFYDMRRYNKEDSEITLVSNGASQILVNGVDGSLIVQGTDTAGARVEVSSAHGARVVLDASNTNGTIVLAGLIELDDQSGAGCAVDVSRVTVDGLEKTAAAILGSVV